MGKFESLTDEQLVNLISPNSEIQKELVKRGILRTKNIVGEIGEYFTFKFFKESKDLDNLIYPPPVTKNIDFISNKGDRYTVKTVTNMYRRTGVFWDPESIKNEDQIFEYLIIVILNDNYNLRKMIKLDWKKFIEFKRYNKIQNNFYVPLTKKLYKNVEVLFESDSDLV